MKISYKHLKDFLIKDPTIEDISETLFQLGHENEILNNEIIDIDFTPNRGDCLGVRCIARDLASAGMGTLKNLNVKIIEDSAESLGGSLKSGKKSGSLGDISCLSFHATKIITAGQGGAVLTDDDKLFERLKVNKLSKIKVILLKHYI